MMVMMMPATVMMMMVVVVARQLNLRLAGWCHPICVDRLKKQACVGDGLKQVGI
jgi:hypothetical protein